MKILRKISVFILSLVFGLFFLITSFAQEENRIELSENGDGNLFVEAQLLGITSSENTNLEINFIVRNNGERDIDWAVAKLTKYPEGAEYYENTVDFGAVSFDKSSNAAVKLSVPNNVYDKPLNNSSLSSDDDKPDQNNYIYIIGAVIAVCVLTGILSITIIKRKGKGGGMILIAFITAASLLTIGFYAEDLNDEHVIDIDVKVILNDDSYLDLSFEFMYGYTAEINSQPVMGVRKASQKADYNTPKISESRMSAGAGPLGEQNIYIGTDGQYYFIGDTLQDYTGENLCKESTLERYEKILTERMNWLKDQDIDFYFVICPNKNSIYNDIDPEKLEMAEFRRIDQVVKHLRENTELKVIDLRDALLNGKEVFEEGLYYKYDTHWNNYGGYLGYREIMRNISRDYPKTRTRMLSEYQIDLQETYMKDMLWYLGYYSAFKDYSPVFTLKSGNFASLTASAHDGVGGQYQFSRYWEDGYADYSNYLEYKNDNLKDAPSLYMIRDSFGISLAPFLKDSFSHSVFEWTADFSKSAILKAEPDIVIFEIVERNLQEIISARALKD